MIIKDKALEFSPVNGGIGPIAPANCGMLTVESAKKIRKNYKNPWINLLSFEK